MAPMTQVPAASPTKAPPAPPAPTPLPAARFRVPFLVWVGLALLTLSLIGAHRGLPLSTNPGGTSGPPAGAVPLMPRQAVCFGHYEPEHGVIGVAPLQPGRVAGVEVEEDQDVPAGKVLFRMEDTLARETLVELKADLASAEAQLKQARSLADQHRRQIDGQRTSVDARQHELAAGRLKLTEVQRLGDKDLVGPESLPMTEETVRALESALKGEKIKLEALEQADAKEAIIRAEQDVKVRQARLRKAQFALDECEVKAPSAGKVLRLQVIAGEWISPNPRQVPVSFCPAGPRLIRAEVEQEFANRAVKGATAFIQDDTRKSPTWKGKVVRVSGWQGPRRSILLEPLQFNDVRTVEFFIELTDSPEPPLKIGQRVRVTLPPPA